MRRGGSGGRSEGNTGGRCGNAALAHYSEAHRDKLAAAAESEAKECDALAAAHRAMAK
jgi:hypothetical protein